MADLISSNVVIARVHKLINRKQTIRVKALRGRIKRLPEGCRQMGVAAYVKRGA